MFDHISRLIVAIVILLIAVTAPGLALDGSVLSGTWETANLSEITIKPCKEGQCGYISKVSLAPELYKKHKVNVDKIGMQNLPDAFNQDPKLRARPLKGLKILILKNQESSTRFSGQIYNAEDGGTYNGFIDIIDQKTLKLTGCGFFDLICKSESWYKVGPAN